MTEYPKLLKNGYECGQVIDYDFETGETIVQLIYKPNQYIRAKGIRNAINDLRYKSKFGSKGYFVCLNHYEDGWYIIAQSETLKWFDSVNDNYYAHRYNERKTLQDAQNNESKSISIVFGKESGIDTFNRSKNSHKNGYAREVKRIDSNKKNGYGIKGDFISLTMSKPTTLYENRLYLDCSRGKTYKEDVIHLFDIKDSKVHLIAKGNRISDIWDDMEKWFSNQAEISMLTLFDIITKHTKDKEKLLQFADFLYEYCNRNSYYFSDVDQWLEHQMVSEIIHQPLTEMEDVTNDECYLE